MEVSEDSSLLAVGFSDSVIKVWSLLPQKLKTMKSGEQLADVVTEAGELEIDENKLEIAKNKLFNILLDRGRFGEDDGRKNSGISQALAWTQWTCILFIF